MKSVITAILSLVLMQSATASQLCPNTISTKQTLQGSQTGWESFTDRENTSTRLSGITLYSGHPKEMASLAPDNEGTSSDKLTWRFDQEKESQGIWLACQYEHTQIQLIKKLPATLTTCSALYQSRNEVANPRIISVECN